MEQLTIDGSLTSFVLVARKTKPHAPATAARSPGTKQLNETWPALIRGGSEPDRVSDPRTQIVHLILLSRGFCSSTGPLNDHRPGDGAQQADIVPSGKPIGLAVVASPGPFSDER